MDEFEEHFAMSNTSEKDKYCMVFICVKLIETE